MRNIVLFLFVLAGSMIAAPVWAQVCLPPPPGMVSWWPGDGNPNDIIGTNNGTLQGGVTFANGKVAQAFSMNGAGFVNVPYHPSLDSPQITVDAWVSPSSHQFTDSIINKRTPGNVGGYTLERSGANDGICWTVFVAGAYRGTCSNIPLPNNSWTHVAGTYDGATFRLYFNGQEVAPPAAFAGIINPVVADLQIGRNIVNGSAWNGLIDEVEVFNRALTPTEILAIFAAGSAGKCKPGSAPRAAYVANAGSNTVSVINPTTNIVVATIPVGTNPVNIAVTPNGTSAYVTNAGSNSVSVINTATNAVVATVPVGPNPVNVAITPNGASAYVTNASSNSVSVINTATNAVVATVPVGPNPVNVAITPDGTRAYVTNAGSFTVTVIDTTTNTVVATVPVGINPVNVVIR